MTDSAPKIKSWRAWQRALTKERGAEQAADLLARVRRRYESLYAQRLSVSHPALRTHLDQVILPGLALYQTLLEDEGMERPDAICLVERCLCAALENQRRAMVIFGRLPFLFPLFRWAMRRIMAQEYPPEEFTVEWVQDDQTCIGFNMTSCFYLKTLTAFGAPELTPAYCRADDYLAEAFVPAIQFRRTQTLGMGGSHCDFRYLRAAKN